MNQGEWDRVRHVRELFQVFVKNPNNNYVALIKEQR